MLPSWLQERMRISALTSNLKSVFHVQYYQRWTYVQANYILTPAPYRSLTRMNKRFRTSQK